MAPEFEHNEQHPIKAEERPALVDEVENEQAVPGISQDQSFNRPPTMPRKASSMFSHTDQGSRERIAHGLQQQKGNAFVQRMIQQKNIAVSRVTVTDTPAQQMEKGANAEEAQVAAAPPPRVAEMSTINDAEQARQQITKVENAQKNLFAAQAVNEREKKEASSSYSAGAEADNKVIQTKGFIDKDEEVKGTLQGIVDLSVGSSTPVKTEGNNPDIDVTVGANMRLSTFSTLFANLERDFAPCERCGWRISRPTPKRQEQ